MLECGFVSVIHCREIDQEVSSVELKYLRQSHKSKH